MRGRPAHDPVRAPDRRLSVAARSGERLPGGAGRGGSWETAARDHAEPAGRPDGCKGRAAYAVLTGLLEFHEQHPGTTVRLGSAPDGAPACGYGIAAVDAGTDGTAWPGEVIRIELRGTYLDHAELLRDGGVSVDGVSVPGPLTPSASP
ncbi:hypothetical protein [Streptomyces sp. NPDC058812]|uniref:hypothetical protein n=1 Tax=unclassified Streptomyces TaxID=2593676 RepID=UPI0036A61A29